MSGEFKPHTSPDQPEGTPEQKTAEMSELEARFPGIDSRNLYPEDVELVRSLAMEGVLKRDFDAWAARTTMEAMGPAGNDRRRLVVVLSRETGSHEKKMDDILKLPKRK